MAERFMTPLRYPGGKGRLTPYFEKVILENDLKGGVYVEPFAGGAGIALNLLNRQYVSEIYINDYDPKIHSFWKSVVEYSDEFIQLIEDTDVTYEEWVRQRNILFDHDSDILSKGFATFFLNRTNRSGIIAAGPIGGKNQSGEYRIDARFNKTELIRRIKFISDNAERIIVSSCDAIEFLRRIDLDKDSSLLYIDPPYYVKGESLYMNYFTDDDHVKLSNVVKSLPYNWVISYDDIPRIRSLYSECNSLDFTLYYSAFKSYVGKEVFFVSDNMRMPSKLEVMNH